MVMGGGEWRASDGRLCQLLGTDEADKRVRRGRGFGSGGRWYGLLVLVWKLRAGDPREAQAPGNAPGDASRPEHFARLHRAASKPARSNMNHHFV